MRDKFGRKIDYLRISVTDRCNLRCSYCMPREGITLTDMSELLTYEEILKVCSIAAGLGIRKIKLTGGEPLVRKGCPSLVGLIKAIPGIKQVTMTTNGILVEEYLDELKTQGLDGINISLDTLDPREYLWVTGSDALEHVRKGIDAAYDSGIPVKINVVLRKNCDWRKMISLAKNRRIHVRFIELMPIGLGKNEAGISADILLDEMRTEFPTMKADETVHGNGPAEYYRIPGYEGSIGIIHAMHGKFCDSCNRIRLTSTGRIKPCLCFGTSFDIKEALRKGNGSEVEEILRRAIAEKPAAHCFEHPDQITEEGRMSSIGG